MDVHVRILMLLMKNLGQDDVILESLPRWYEDFLQLLQKPMGLEAFQTFLQYIFWASNQKVTPEAFNKALEAAGDARVQKIQEVVVTVAEMLEKKGEEPGIRLGGSGFRERILTCQDLDLLDR